MFSETVKASFYTVEESADILYQQAKDAFRLSDFSQASKLIDRAERLYKNADDTEGIVLVQNLRARILIEQGKRSEAQQILIKAIESSPESIYRAKLHNTLSRTFNVNTETQSGLEELYKALEYTYKLTDTEKNHLSAEIFQRLATLLSTIGRTEESFQYFAESIRFAEKANDPLQLSTIYNNLGVSYNRFGQLDNALFHLQRALELALEENGLVEEYRARVNLGNTYVNFGLFEAALDQYNLALTAFQILQPGAAPIIIMHNQGRTLAMMERYNEAEDLLKQSLALSEEQNIMEGIYYNASELGKMYAVQNETGRALPYFKRAAELAESLNNSEFRIETLNELHHLYAQKGQFEVAYEKLLRYYAISDSLNKVQYTRELALAENYIELSRQREINSLLQQQQLQKTRQLRTQSVLMVVSLLALLFLVLLMIQMKRSVASKQIIMDELESQKQKLEEANQSKDKLFAIVSHDLRNALASMEGILTLLSEDEISMEEFRQLIPEVEAIVQENSRVIIDLLTWAKEQLSGVRMDFMKIDIAAITGEVLQSQKSKAAKKNIIATANWPNPEIPTVWADYNALTFILRNLISNSIKFTNNGGEITVSAENREETVLIIIRDTGIGIDDEVKKYIFTDVIRSRKGTANEQGTGFGLKLSRDFAERMNGSLHFESTENKGTTFYVELPKAK